MSMYDSAAERYDELKSERRLRARNKRLIALNSELIAALEDLLGDRPDIQSGHCVRCGRDYSDAPKLQGAHCSSDDCPGFAARQLCARVKAGAA
jgi:hypothetical protein